MTLREWRLKQPATLVFQQPLLVNAVSETTVAVHGAQRFSKPISNLMQ
jgi:hypothetical protein